MTKRKGHQDDFLAIKEVILEWQPFPWIPPDINDPELDGEIRAIYKQVNRINSPVDAAHVIARVFASSFNDDSRFNADTCQQVGAVLYTTLEERGKP